MNGFVCICKFISASAYEYTNIIWLMNENENNNNHIFLVNWKYEIFW